MKNKYAYSFKEADRNRMIVGLNSIYEQFRWKNAPSFINKEHILREELSQYTDSIALLGATCLQMHLEYLQFIQEKIDPLATLTIGYIEYNGQFMYKFPKENIKKWFEEGILSTENRMKLNLHAWITLSNLEIIDLTLPFLISKVQKQNLPFYPFLLGSPEKNGIRTIYHPVIIGNDYADKIYSSLFHS